MVPDSVRPGFTAEISLPIQGFSARLLDPVALARLCLIGYEIQQRGFYLSQDDLVSLLLDLEDPQTVIDYLRTGNQLHVDAVTALKACMNLNGLGLQGESRRIFELAEPLDLLKGARLQGQRAPEDAVSLLEYWAQAAVSFRSIEGLIQDIRQIQLEVDRFGREDSEESSPILQSRLLVYAGLELSHQQRWGDLELLLGSFNLSRHWIGRDGSGSILEPTKIGSRKVT